MSLADKSESIFSELRHTDHLLSCATQLIITLLRSLYTTTRSLYNTVDVFIPGCLQNWGMMITMYSLLLSLLLCKALTPNRSTSHINYCRNDSYIYRYASILCIIHVCLNVMHFLNVFLGLGGDGRYSCDIHSQDYTCQVQQRSIQWYGLTFASWPSTYILSTITVHSCC